MPAYDDAGGSSSITQFDVNTTDRLALVKNDAVGWSFGPYPKPDDVRRTFVAYVVLSFTMRNPLVPSPEPPLMTTELGM